MSLERTRQCRGLPLAVLFGLALSCPGCSAGERETAEQQQQAQSKVFAGCDVPLPVAGGRSITGFTFQEGRELTARELSFWVSDPKLAPEEYLFWAFPISDAGAGSVRKNAKHSDKPSAYRSMSSADQYSMDMVTFHARPVRFNDEAGFGRLTEERGLPTDTLIFLQPGWVIGAAVSKERVGLAPAIRAAASAALNAMLSVQGGCS